MTLHDAFLVLKANLEPSPTHISSIERRHNAVRSVIENKISHAKTQLIGSLQRQTRISPLNDDKFDIDILVELGSFSGWGPNGVTPDMASSSVHGILEESDRYSQMDPFVDHPTVSLSYSDDVSVELVPAYRDLVGHSPTGISHQPIGRAFWVPDGNTWKLADYDHEAAIITTCNTLCEGKFIPTVKMLKDLKRKHFSNLGSFHLETLAAHTLPSIYTAAKNSGATLSYPEMITAFFSRSSTLLDQQIRMPGSVSPHISLDPAHVSVTQKAFDVFSRYCDSQPTGSYAQQRSHWREIFTDTFPA